mmetsp:Transcript_45000/g.88310  ORF Transcript_45000/g.88310 Transcript_45000/m.88310 type:complete len:847 (+) Transcript_45000:104-2644(+)|eukprot:CAMPEP_0175143098 /NCGR_PEP_ID=MMETSP0087-20121206/13223_1 /TAXON_ID=136419 /ORGANISM="Unknown Unknown, Strain D1" /LENGTH=846 /DNA_ID=CAMNT_0016427089 /DNA_START=107 /DNA_END=2647 /DNA_ORIENTATION=+
MALADPKQLINLCMECIESFNPLRITAATQVEDFSKKHKLPDGVKSFVQEVFYGSERYTKMIKTVLDGLYTKYSSSVARTDFYMFWVYTILTLTKLKELGIDQFRKFVLAQEPHNMRTFLGFLWDPKNICHDGWLEDQLARIYDITYVRDVLIGTLKEFQPGVDDILAELDHKLQHNELGVDDTASAEETAPRPRQVTEPKPFSFHQSAPRPVRPRTPIYKTDYKANTIPDKIRKTSLEQIARAKEERRQELRAEVIAKHSKFVNQKLNVLERPSNLEALRAAKEEEIRQLQQPVKAKPIPEQVFKKEINVRRTAAQILRDEALYRRKAEEEAAEILRFEQELRDSSELERYRLKMEAKDEEEKQLKIAQTRQEMKDAAVKAKEAAEKLLEENIENVKAMKLDMELKLEEREKDIEAEIQEKRELKEAVEASKANVELQVQRVLEEKKEEAEKAVAARERRAKKLQRENEIEMERRKELIREIKAMEKLANERAKRPKEFDPSTSSGLGLLEEMSITELKERLSLVQVEASEAESRRRQKILVDKSDRQAALDAMVRHHTKMRREARTIGEQERTHRRTLERETAKQEKERKEMLMSDWQERDAAKKAEKRARALQLARELKAKKIAENFELGAKGGRVDAGAAAAQAKEEKLQKDMERGFRRQEKAKERELAAAMELAMQVKRKDQRKRESDQRIVKKQQLKMRREYDEHVARLSKEVKVISQVEDNIKRMRATEAKRQRNEAIADFKFQHPYATRLEKRQERQRQRKIKSAQSSRDLHHNHRTERRGSTRSSARISTLDLSRAVDSQLSGHSNLQQISGRSTRFVEHELQKTERQNVHFQSESV